MCCLSRSVSLLLLVMVVLEHVHMVGFYGSSHRALRPSELELLRKPPFRERGGFVIRCHFGSRSSRGDHSLDPTGRSPLGDEASGWRSAAWWPRARALAPGTGMCCVGLGEGRGLGPFVGCAGGCPWPRGSGPAWCRPCGYAWACRVRVAPLSLVARGVAVGRRPAPPHSGRFPSAVPCAASVDRAQPRVRASVFFCPGVPLAPLHGVGGLSSGLLSPWARSFLSSPSRAVVLPLSGGPCPLWANREVASGR
jgi:hypothetical protein